jgi:hypothetical protein
VEICLFKRSFVVLVLFGLVGCSPSGEALPQLGIDVKQTSASGLSGACMAGQLQVAHSSQIIGAALLAGGPYGCAETGSEGISRVKLLRSAYKYDAVVVFLQCRAQMALPGRFHQTPMQEMQVSPMGMAERHRLHMVVGRKAPLKIELLGVVSRALPVQFRS